MRWRRRTHAKGASRKRQLPRAVVLAALSVTLVGALVSIASGLNLIPVNDLFAIGQGGGENPTPAPLVKRAEPAQTATPLVKCGPGSRPQPGVDGRVPAGSASKGLFCNIKQIGHQGTEGGFKVYRYIDRRGHDCAYYDQTLMLPFNALNPGAGSEGVAVL